MANKVRPLPCMGSDLNDRRNSGGSIWRQNTLQLFAEIATGSQKKHSQIQSEALPSTAFDICFTKIVYIYIFLKVWAWFGSTLVRD